MRPKDRSSAPAIGDATTCAPCGGQAALRFGEWRAALGAQPSAVPISQDRDERGGRMVHHESSSRARTRAVAAPSRAILRGPDPSLRRMPELNWGKRHMARLAFFRFVAWGGSIAIACAAFAAFADSTDTAKPVPKGNPALGKKIFSVKCVPCHKADGSG